MADLTIRNTHTKPRCHFSITRIFFNLCILLSIVGSVEKRAPPSAGGIVKWHSHSEGQTGSVYYKCNLARALQSVTPHVGSHSSSHKDVCFVILKSKRFKGSPCRCVQVNQVIPSCHPDNEDGDTIKTYDSQEILISDQWCNSEQRPK